MDEYPTLKKFLGEKFINEMINLIGQKKHPLYRLLSNNTPRNSTILRNLDDNIKVILDILGSDGDRTKNLEHKLKNPDTFYDTLPEIDFAVYFHKTGCPTVIEPNFPKAGPDLKVTIKDRDIYFEIFSMGVGENEKKQDKIRNEIGCQVKKINSEFYITADSRGELNGEDIKPIVTVIKNSLAKLEKNQNKQPLVMYYFSPLDIKEGHGYDRLRYPNDINFRSKEYPLFSNELRYRDKCKVRIGFIHEDIPGPTCVSWGYDISEDNTYRIKRKINKKLKQLPKDVPDVVIVDITSTYADEFNIENASSGELRYWINKKTGAAQAYRSKNGIFQIIKRISAVVAYKREWDGDNIKPKIELYKANVEPRNPLTEDEIQKIKHIENV